MAGPVIRRIRGDEIDATARMWRRSQRAAYTWFRDDQFHPLAEALDFFRTSICERCRVDVAVDRDRIVGVLALEGAFVDHLFVDPELQGMGVGSRLLEHAKRLHPGGLRLVTLQRNRRARDFYEARGFGTTRFDVSPPPESEPDVWYEWRPAGTASAARG